MSIQYGKIYKTKTPQHFCEPTKKLTSVTGETIPVPQNTNIIPIKSIPWRKSGEKAVLCLINKKVLFYGHYEADFLVENELVEK